MRHSIKRFIILAVIALVLVLSTATVFAGGPGYFPTGATSGETTDGGPGYFPTGGPGFFPVGSA
jgi:hypothetical protein